MPGADKTGLADPYVTVILNEKIDKTMVSLCTFKFIGQ